MKTQIQQVQLRIPVDVHQAIKSAACQQERSVNWLINKVLADAAAKLKQEAKQ